MKPNFPMEFLKQALEHCLTNGNIYTETRVAVTTTDNSLEVHPLTCEAFHFPEEIVNFSRAFNMNCYFSYDSEKKHVYAHIF